MQPSSWVEVSRSALAHNLAALRSLCGTATRLAPVVKANAYGHGLRLCAEAFVAAGADALCTNDLAEAAAVVDLGRPVLVLGPTSPADADEIATLGCEPTMTSLSQLHALARAGIRSGRPVPVHVKLETGTNRQGLPEPEARALVDLALRTEGVRLAGVSTHLADVEDETEHTFAQVQLARFEAAFAGLPAGVLRHCAASAAHLLFARARFDLVRPGIACFGLWPSPETRIASEIVHGAALELRPALTWKTRIAEVKDAARGDYVGYGRSLRLSRPSRIAVLPVGYYDGYDRRLSNTGAVLVRGQRAPVAGRVCMNLLMIDVTGIDGVVPGDEVVLLGGAVDADALAAAMGTINYEVVSRIHERLLRVAVA